MRLTLYLHPFSSYCQKAVTAFYEKGIGFETRLLDGSEPVASEFAALWPVGRFPVLKAADELIFDATAIIEYIESRYPEHPPLIPRDAVAASKVRMLDRFFDNYVQYPQQRVIYEALGREPDAGDGGERWKDVFNKAWTVLERHMEGREWVAGDCFTLADCSAAPALLYADWTIPIDERFRNIHAYRSRLLARRSYARVLDEARPWRHLFPLGAPEGRD